MVNNKIRQTEFDQNGDYAPFIVNISTFNRLVVLLKKNDIQWFKYSI